MKLMISRIKLASDVIIDMTTQVQVSLGTEMATVVLVGMELPSMKQRVD
jgi:hypothetical protein